ncbi:MAG TPA: SDR family NAD(P)-dependent oxidoreductase [Pseudomonadales bacterium]|nr:SDR family NAD(P)-dependent oxidoreductase [Pseudomonadales bacterium]
MDNHVAIIGMACRFPGARNLEEFWANLIGGIESITRFSDQELMEAGISAATLARPDYVKAAPVLDDPGLFDAAFFGFSPAEAAAMDPQHRLLLELSYTALEDAGCDTKRYRGRTGVFAGSAMNTYFMNRGLDARFAEDYIPTLIVNDKDFLATRLSYKLGLSGPSMTVQTACSTSLVAIHLARQSLLSGEVDMAMAGTVSVRVPHRAGYFYDGGGIVSPDGHVRAFDAGANGTVFGSGGGVIVMKRLEDALAEGDQIYAVIRGSAVNNDGSAKVGYTAPSVDGQADVIVEALANADVDVESIAYVEAHGSGTPVGDPIEVFALTKAFRNFTQRNGFCAIGSVKTNVGHLDAAAGMAGIIKTAMALKHRRIPPTLHFTKPNPEINFPTTPFYVNTQAMEWDRGNEPRRAGVMSTGMGGTNAHAILEEAPAAAPRKETGKPQVIILSAKTPSALDAMSGNLENFLGMTDSGRSLADVAHTLQTGRQQFSYRRFAVSHSAEGAAAAFKKQEAQKQVLKQGSASRPVVFLLPGVGDHYLGMGHGLYENFDVFRQEMDRCARILQPLLNVDIREIMFPPGHSTKKSTEARGIDMKRMLGRGTDTMPDPAAQKLDQTIYCQPALFFLEYALARLWMHWGIRPERIIGHSLGEYVAACLAEVFSLEDALKLVATRAKLANELPQGSMLAVMLPEKELLPMLDGQLSISLINSPNLCVVSGPVSKVSDFQSQLTEQEVVFRPVRNAHAFHSRMLDPIVDPFVQEIKRVRLNAPRIPFTSNITGTWITNKQASDPSYWADQARYTARFSNALEQLWKIPECLPLEIGPGRTLGVLAMQHPARNAVEGPQVLSSLRHDYENESDPHFILNSVGKLWVAGIGIDWEKFDSRPDQRKISLPTYPFERQRYWIETPGGRPSDATVKNQTERKTDLADWFYVPVWERTIFPAPLASSTDHETSWLIIGEQSDFTNRLTSTLKQRGANVSCAFFGKGFASRHNKTYEIGADCLDDYVQLLGTLKTNLRQSLNVVHLGSLSTRIKSPDAGYDESSQDFGFYSLMNLAKAIGEQEISAPIRIGVMTSQIHDVTGGEKLNPAMATVLGPCGVMPKEYSNVTSFSIDLPEAPSSVQNPDKTISHLLDEFREPVKGAVIAYRGKYRWQRAFKPRRLPAITAQTASEEIQAQGLRQRGVYLITGGTGGIGLTIAKYLAQTCQARLVLTKKSPFPEKSTWRKRLAAGDLSDSDKRITSVLLEIEALGGEVDVFACDVADQAGMNRVIAETQQKHKAIHGVFHGAGIIGVGLMQFKTKEASEKVFSPKISGSLALVAALKDVNLDFLGLVSSLSSVTMPFAHADYCAAHSFMDAFGYYFQSQKNCRVLNINWPIWQEVGILADMKAQIGVEEWRDEALQKGIRTRDGVEALKRALSANDPQIAVCPENLDFIIEQSWKILPASKTFSTGMANPRVNRGNLSVEEPKNEMERTVAGIWTEILGITPISVEENFFALGGHSLLAVQIIGKINRALRVNLPVPIFFQNPTIRGLAAVLALENHGKREPKVVPLQPGRSEGALFFIDASIGLCRLAQHLGDAGPAIYGTVVPLSPKTFEAASRDQIKQLPSMKDWAAMHTDLIQHHYPSGDCFLAGFSFGGLLAFEVAHQLQQMGRKVVMIFLLDSLAIIPPAPPWWQRLQGLTYGRVKASLKFRMVRLSSKANARMMSAIEQLFSIPQSDKLQAKGLNKIDHPVGDVSWEIMEKIFYQARKSYQFLPIQSHAVLFRARHNTDAIFRHPGQTNLGWDGLFKKGLQMVEVPGDHLSFLKDPHVITLAERFKEYLVDLSASESTPTPSNKNPSPTPIQNF